MIHWIMGIQMIYHSKQMTGMLIMNLRLKNTLTNMCNDRFLFFFPFRFSFLFLSILFYFHFFFISHDLCQRSAGYFRARTAQYRTEIYKGKGRSISSLALRL